MTCPARRFARDHAVPRRQEQDLEGKVLRFLMRGDGGSRRPAGLTLLAGAVPGGSGPPGVFCAGKEKACKG